MAHQPSTLLPLLAQLDILTPPPTLPSLPGPPAIQHALFENPVPLVILVVGLGLVAYAIAVRLDRRKIGLLAGGVAVGLGVGLVVLARAVETGREQVQARTRALVAAVAEADAAALDRLLAPEARLYARGTGPGWDKGAIIDWIETTLGPGGVYEVEAHRIGEIQAEIGPSGRTARTRARVTVTPVDNSPLGFVCMMTWQETDEWILLEIEPLWLQGWGEISQQHMRERPRW